METNYYLIRKTEYNTWTSSHLGCAEPPTDVQHLTNGWLWNNTYYATIEDLNKDYYQRIHIGKSSFCWHFLLQIYPEIGINNFEDWKMFFNNPNNKIVNDNYEEISSEEMIKEIADRKGLFFDENLSQEENEKSLITKINDIRTSFMECSISNYVPVLYMDYDDYLADNNAIRGINGLFAHDPEKFKNIIMVGTEFNKTYDYIRDVVFD